MLYLYAIVGRTPSLAGERGVFGEPLFALAAGGLAAVVGEADATPDRSRDRLVAHHEVVMRLAARQATLPARFGQLVEEHAITADLRAREPALREALSLVEGCVQMTLRVDADARPVEGLRRALSSTVRAEKVQVHQGEEPFASLYHLVPKALVDDWTRALEKERARTGARIAATGPWPVYAFAPAFA